MQVNNSNRLSFQARLNLSCVKSAMMEKTQLSKLTQNASRIGDSNDVINVEVKSIDPIDKIIREGLLYASSYDVKMNATIQNKLFKPKTPNWRRIEIYRQSPDNPFSEINEFLRSLHKKFPNYFVSPKVAAHNMYETMDVAAQDLKRFLFKRQISIPKSVQGYLKNADVVAQAYANGDLHKLGLTYFRYVRKVQTQYSSVWGFKLPPTMKAFVDSLISKAMNNESNYNSKDIAIPKRRLYKYVTKQYSFDETLN